MLTKFNISFILLISGLVVNSQTFKDCHCYKKQESIYSIEAFNVEQKPVFSGGEMALLKYIIENIKYPLTNEEDLQTSVYIYFIIGENGTVLNACIMRPLYNDGLTNLEKEVLRVIMEMPQWTPAQNKGKNVAVWMIVPIHINYK